MDITPEERKYCQDGCGTILDNLYGKPHRKFCDACNKKRAFAQSKASQAKNREKYRIREYEKRQSKKLEVQNA